MDSAPPPQSTVPIADLLHHAEFVRRLARRLVSNRSRADDLVQEVWIRSLEHPPLRGHVRAWLARVTRNLVRDESRRASARRRRERAVVESESRLVTEEGTAHVTAAISHLGQALNSLPATYREAIYLRYYEDLGPREIADRLGLPVATVKTRLRRGLELIRRDMGQRVGDQGRLRAILLPLCTSPRVLGPSTTGPVGWGAPVVKTVAVTGAILVVTGGLLLWSGDILRPTPAPGEREPARIAARPGGEEKRLSGAGIESPRPRHETDVARTPMVHASNPEARGPVSGIVRHAVSKDPVPFYSFRLQEGASSESVTTDEGGRFETTRSFPLHLTALLVHTPPPPPSEAVGSKVVDAKLGVGTPVSAMDPRSPPSSDRAAPSMAKAEARSIERAELEDPVEIAVHVGPTFFLDVELPPGLAPGDLSAVYTHQPYAWSAPAARVAPVQGTEQLWVRFPPEEDTLGDRVSWRLRLLSTDRRYAGTAKVPFVRGTHFPPVKVELEGAASIIGVVRDQHGRPISGLHLHLQAREGRFLQPLETDADGRFETGPIRPGSYAVYHHDPDYFPCSVGRQVSAGVEESVGIVLTLRPPGGALSGRITSATGDYRGRVVLFLEGLGDQVLWRRFEPQWVEEEGRWVADFSFEELRQASYRLVCCTTDAVPIEGRVLTLVPPVDGIRFQIQDDAEVSRLSLRAFDRVTGEAIERYRVFIDPQGSVERLYRGSSETPWSGDFHEGVEFTWRVHAAGYRAVTGDRSDFGRETGLDVHLEAGFSAVINLISSDTYRSLPSVEVFADGRSVGLTNEYGMLFVDLPARPQLIGFDPNQWTIFGCSSDIDVFRSEMDPERWDQNEVVLSAHLQRVR